MMPSAKAKSLRILFIKSVINSSQFSFDIGIGTLVSVLKRQGYSVDLFVVTSWEQLFALYYRIETTTPDLLAFSTYASSFMSTAKMSSLIKRKFPKLHQIIGGIHMVLNPEDIYKIPAVDAVCIGEGEIALPNYLKRWQQHNRSHIHTRGFWVRSGNTIIKNPPEPIITDLNLLPFPDREIFNVQSITGSIIYGKRALEFLFTRGCPFNCSYCSNHALRKVYGAQHYVRHLTPQRAIDLIRHDTAKFSYDMLFFHDDTFTCDRKWMYEFLELYKAIKIPFACNVRVGTVTKNDLIKLKQSGCMAVFAGVESGDSNLRLRVMRRAIANDAIIQLFDWAHEIGLKTLAFLMMGIPKETPSGFFKTVELVKRIAPDWLSLSIFYPYPGTDLYDICRSEKYLQKHLPTDFIERTDSPLHMPQFPRVNILYYYHQFNKLVFNARGSDSASKHVHRRFKYFLLTIPPTSRMFILTQAVCTVDDFILEIKNKLQHTFL